MLSHGCIITFFVPINLYQFVINCLFLVRKLCEYLNATLLLSTAFPPLQAIIYAVYCHHSRKRRTSLMNLTCMIIVIMWTIGLNLRMCHKNVAQKLNYQTETDKDVLEMYWGGPPLVPGSHMVRAAQSISRAGGVLHPWTSEWLRVISYIRIRVSAPL